MVSVRARTLAVLATVGAAIASSSAGFAIGTTPEPDLRGEVASEAGAGNPSPATPVVWVRGQELELVAAGQQARDRGTRVDAKGNDLWEISALGSFDLPAAAERAYRQAAAGMAAERPSCQLPWTLLAGIGRVESDHGRYGGSVLGSDGVSRPAIRGVALNGVGPVAAIPDSDNGRLDDDRTWDRAVGPMQFIPTTWASSGRDGDGDGVESPHDLDDAALAAAGYLCPAYGSILAPESMRAAIFSYNQSDYYVALVLAFEEGYRTGTFSIPSPPPPDGAKDTSHPARDGGGSGGGGAGPSSTGPTGPGDPKGTGGPDGPVSDGAGPKNPGGSGGSGGSGGQPGGSPSPAPAPSPSPTPAPAPPPPSFSERSGVLAVCEDGWCLDGLHLDLGPATKLGQPALADHDDDGIIESNREELTGLEGATVKIRVQDGTEPALVVELQGEAY